MKHFDANLVKIYSAVIEILSILFLYFLVMADAGQL